MNPVEGTSLAVDAALADWLLPDDPALVEVLRASAQAGLPDIAVSPLQARFLQLLVEVSGARRVVEVGTLGGYSAVHLARGLGPGGRVTTLEVDPVAVRTARANLELCGLAEQVEVVEGPAAETLALIRPDPPVDLVFIDADKPASTVYLREALRLCRPGALVVLDNVVRQGRVTEATSEDPSVRGTREALAYLGAEPRFAATALQTLGLKGYDGVALAVVRRP